MTEHTPGPWIADYRGVYTAKGTTDTGYGAMIADCPRAAGRNGALEASANAALIAAAPDLLAAAERVIECSYLISPVTGRQFCVECGAFFVSDKHTADCYIPALVAAIKKAKGQQ